MRFGCLLLLLVAVALMLPQKLLICSCCHCCCCYCCYWCYKLNTPWLFNSLPFFFSASSAYQLLQCNHTTTDVNLICWPKLRSIAAAAATAAATAQHNNNNNSGSNWNCYQTYAGKHRLFFFLAKITKKILN